MFAVELLVSVVYAFAILAVGWTGVVLLARGAVAAALHIRFDRASARFLGGIVAGLILALDSITVGVEVAQGGDDPPGLTSAGEVRPTHDRRAVAGHGRAGRPVSRRRPAPGSPGA